MSRDPLFEEHERTISIARFGWSGDYSEPCACGHDGGHHCLDDNHCTWFEELGQRGGACFEKGCDCATYRPASAKAVKR